MCRKDLISSLAHIWDVVRPCFPPYFDVFGIYCNEFHKRIYGIFTLWVSPPPSLLREKLLVLLRPLDSNLLEVVSRSNLVF
jgi:hypothetical protein